MRIQKAVRRLVAQSLERDKKMVIENKVCPKCDKGGISYTLYDLGVDFQMGKEHYVQTVFTWRFEMLLEIKDLSVEVEGKEILHNINLEIDHGETHVLFGRNGSGKTSLLMAIMGISGYKITKGRIFFKGVDIIFILYF